MKVQTSRRIEPLPPEHTPELADAFDGMRRNLGFIAVIATFGFLNRWNDTMGTPLEDEPLAVGAQFLAPHGWTPGKHEKRSWSGD